MFSKSKSCLWMKLVSWWSISTSIRFSGQGSTLVFKVSLDTWAAPHLGFSPMNAGSPGETYAWAVPVCSLKAGAPQKEALPLFGNLIWNHHTITVWFCFPPRSGNSKQTQRSSPSSGKICLPQLPLTFKSCWDIKYLSTGSSLFDDTDSHQLELLYIYEMIKLIIS